MAGLPVEISAEEVKSLLDAPAKEAPRLIDCREEDEWRICRIEGAELMPLSRFGEEAPGRLTDTAQRLILYCHHGMRSLRAAAWLRQKGFHSAQSMRGGIDHWADTVEPGMAKY